MTETLPPPDRKYSVLAEKALDLVAIVTLGVLAWIKVLDGTLAATLIALIAGANLGQVIKRSGSNGLVVGLIQIMRGHS